MSENESYRNATEAPSTNAPTPHSDLVLRAGQTAVPETPADAPANPTEEKETEELTTVELGGVVFRSRSPLEWTPAEADAVMEIAGDSLRIFAGAPEEETDAERSRRGAEILAPLFTGGRYRSYLALGLWQEGVPFSEATRAVHEAFFKNGVFSFKQTQTGIALAQKAFFG